MTQETSPQDTAADALPDPQDTSADPADSAAPDTAAAAPALNRAERRAQAKGKPSPSGGAQSGVSGSAPRAPGARGGGHVGQVRFPRTGHK